MNTLGKPIAFIATVNASKARHFYEKVLELKCLSDDPFATVFDLGAITLRIQKVESMQQTSHTVLGWEVINIHEKMNKLSKKGIVYEKFPQISQDVKGIWSAPSGAQIEWFKDPDGNTLSLTQLNKEKVTTRGTVVVK